jgi:putative transposase
MGHKSALICAINERSDSTYGAPRILGDLEDAGEYVGRKRVARLMRTAGIVGVSRRRFVCTTKRSAEIPYTRLSPTTDGVGFEPTVRY